MASYSRVSFPFVVWLYKTVGLLKAWAKQETSQQRSYNRFSQTSVGGDLFEDPLDSPVQRTWQSQLVGFSPPNEALHDEQEPSSYQQMAMPPRREIGVNLSSRSEYSSSGGSLSIVRLVASGIGMTQGLAASERGFRGIPATASESTEWTLFYLAVYVLFSICAMGAFAAFYGSCSACLAKPPHVGNSNGRSTTSVMDSNSTSLTLSEEVTNRVVQQLFLLDPKPGRHREFWIDFGSACLSILVGMAWLTLLLFGKLAEIFP